MSEIIEPVKPRSVIPILLIGVFVLIGIFGYLIYQKYRKCEYKDWQNVGKCENGKQKQEREVKSGLFCKNTQQTIDCSLTPVDCDVEWSSWSPCSVSCGSDGIQTQTGMIKTPARFGGTPCPTDLHRTRACDPVPIPCPTDCQVGSWTNWSDCSVSCGQGSKTRTRPVVITPQSGGLPCQELTQTVACENKPCPQDCEVTDWTEFSQCTASCDGGTQYRLRFIKSPPIGDGGLCPSLIETRACNIDPCPTDCQVSQWSDWSVCSVPCGGGSTTRARIVTIPATFGACPPLTETLPCNTQECPVDCQVSNWSNYSECDQPCGGGTQLRTREITMYPNTTGEQCPILFDTRMCNDFSCTAEDCIMGSWNDWSSCSNTCGDTNQSRERQILHDGSKHNCSNLSQTRPCNNPQCPRNCEVTPWSDWSACNALCGGGHQHQTRYIKVYAENGGTCTEPLINERPCNTEPCPVDCELGPWSDWSLCTAACEGGVQNRSRPVNIEPVYGGRPCASTTDQKPCNTQPCNRDCQTKVSDWSEIACVTDSGKNCGSGVQTRDIVITQQSTGQGKQCPTNLVETQSCDLGPCPTDCQVGPWKDSGACDKLCGGGKQLQIRDVIVPASRGGIDCPSLQQYVDCNPQSCPVDCQLSDWTWGSCTQPCGGTQTGTRTVVTPPAYGGKDCDSLTTSRNCNSGLAICPGDPDFYRLYTIVRDIGEDTRGVPGNYDIQITTTNDPSNLENLLPFSIVLFRNSSSTSEFIRWKLDANSHIVVTYPQHNSFGRQYNQDFTLILGLNNQVGFSASIDSGIVFQMTNEGYLTFKNQGGTTVGLSYPEPLHTFFMNNFILIDTDSKNWIVWSFAKD